MKISELLEAYKDIIHKSQMIANVRKNLVLYCYNHEVYFLVKDGNIVIGNINLKPEDSKEIEGGIATQFLFNKTKQ